MFRQAAVCGVTTTAARARVARCSFRAPPTLSLRRGGVCATGLLFVRGGRGHPRRPGGHHGVPLWGTLLGRQLVGRHGVAAGHHRCGHHGRVVVCRRRHGVERKGRVRMRQVLGPVQGVARSTVSLGRYQGDPGWWRDGDRPVNRMVLGSRAWLLRLQAQVEGSRDIWKRPTDTIAN